MEVNERFVKIGKFPVAETIPVDGAFQIKVVGDDNIYHFTCVKTEKKTNNDGTFDEVYILKYQPHE